MANISNTAANAELAALAPLMNSGVITLCSGSMPLNANTALNSGNSILATLNFSPIAFAAPSSGVIIANSITSALGVAVGVVTFARMYQSDGMTVVMDVTAGISGSGAECIINTASIVTGAVVSCLSFTYTITSAP